MRVFLDTNIVLDVIVRREPFVHDSARIWALAETRKLEGLISALSFSNVFYVTRRARSRGDANTAMRLLREVFVPVACDAAVIHRAIDAGFRDFEDAIQHFSALAAGADCLVTRNTEHFPDTDMPVLTPNAFLASYTFE